MNYVVTDWISCFHAFWCFLRPILANFFISGGFAFDHVGGLHNMGFANSGVRLFYTSSIQKVLRDERVKCMFM